MIAETQLGHRATLKTTHQGLNNPRETNSKYYILLGVIFNALSLRPNAPVVIPPGRDMANATPHAAANSFSFFLAGADVYTSGQELAATARATGIAVVPLACLAFADFSQPAFVYMLASSAITMSNTRSSTSSGIPSMTFLSLGSTEEVRNWSLNPRGWFRGRTPGVATRTPVPHHAVKST